MYRSHSVNVWVWVTLWPDLPKFVQKSWWFSPLIQMWFIMQIQFIYWFEKTSICIKFSCIWIICSLTYNFWTKIEIQAIVTVAYMYVVSILHIRWPVRYPDRSCSRPTCSKFHGESCDHLSFSHIFAIIFCKQHLWWHILLEVWLIYLNVSCAATRWHWAELAVLRCKQIFAKCFLSLQK